MGLLGPCQTRAFGLYPESRGNTESLLPPGQVLDKGKTREWRGQGLPGFLPCWRVMPPFGNGRGGGQGKVSGLLNLRHL